MWRQFRENHQVLTSTHWKTVSDHDYIKKDFYQTAEETYFEQKTVFLEILSSLREDPEVKAESAAAKLGDGGMRKSMPRIQLPAFSGSYSEWPAFRDLFRSIVDKDPLVDNVERLHYLKIHIKGEASLLLRNLPTIDGNYSRAWKRLTKHYENKRLLVRASLSSFLALPKMKGESVGDLRKLFHSMLLTMGDVESIGRPISDCSDLFVHLVVELLDGYSRRQWEKTISETTDPPSIDTLKDFLECRVRALEALHPEKSESGARKDSPGSARSHVALQKTKSAERCALCQKEHFILFCDYFRRKTPAQKKEVVEQYKLCLNCFGRHALANCTCKKSCAACRGRHHSTIHNACAMAVTSTSMHAGRADSCGHQVLLATAQVDVKTRYGDLVTVRALVDQGSQVSLVTEALAQRLRLARTPAATVIFGVGGKETGSARGRVTLMLASRVTDFAISISALIIPRITTYGARVKIASTAWPHLEGLQLADPHLRSPGAVELLLDADVITSIFRDGFRKGGRGAPMAQNSTLGWLVR